MGPRTFSKLIGIGLVVAMGLSTPRGAIAGAHDTASLYPGGQPSERVQGRWQAISNRALFLLLRCLEEVTANKPGKAIDTCGSALALDPNNPGAYKLRGEAFLLSGQPKLAKSDFDKAIGLDNNDPESFAGRGDALRELRQFNGALAAFTAALKLAPNDHRIWNARCWTRAIAGSDLSVARQDCDRAIKLNARFAQAFDSRGLVFLKLMRPSDALRDYSAAYRFWPGYAQALYGRGIAKIQLGMIAAGKRDLAKARQQDPSMDTKYASYGIKGFAAPDVCKKPACLKSAPTLLPKAKPDQPPPSATRSAAR